MTGRLLENMILSALVLRKKNMIYINTFDLISQNKKRLKLKNRRKLKIRNENEQKNYEKQKKKKKDS